MSDDQNLTTSAAGLAGITVETVIQLSHARARVADLEGDVNAYRELLQASLDVAADLTTDRNRYRKLYHDLLNQWRVTRQRAA